ncbi:MAG: pirin-like C-terminal cupin domain-containing protein, partial [Methanobacterium sp.]
TPRYQEVKSSQIPEIRLENGVMVKIIAGEMDGVKGAVTEIFADPLYLDVNMPMKSYFEQPIKRGHTVFAYVIEGEGIFGDFDESSEMGTTVSSTNMVIFGDGDYIKVKTDQNPVRFLLISGKPLNEPIARYGPFVMNTSEEIEQALIDLRTDNFVK